MSTANLDSNELAYLSFIDPSFQTNDMVDTQNYQNQLIRSDKLNYIKTADDNDIEYVPQISPQSAKTGGLAPIVPLLTAATPIAYQIAKPFLEKNVYPVIGDYLNRGFSWIKNKLTGKGIYKQGNMKGSGSDTIVLFLNANKDVIKRFENELSQSENAGDFWSKMKSILTQIFEAQTGDGKMARGATKYAMNKDFYRYVKNGKLNKYKMHPNGGPMLYTLNKILDKNQLGDQYKPMKKQLTDKLMSEMGSGIISTGLGSEDIKKYAAQIYPKILGKNSDYAMSHLNKMLSDNPKNFSVNPDYLNDAVTFNNMPSRVVKRKTTQSIKKNGGKKCGKGKTSIKKKDILTLL
jgi:hypothetical protein